VIPPVRTILLLGSGGREHALAWKMAQSPQVERIYALPGSDGIASMEKLICTPGDPANPEFVVRTAQALRADLVVVGPEKPLANGVVDALERAGIPTLGPSAAAAQLESSKIFAKKFMTEYGIPTSYFKACDNYDTAIAVCNAWDIERHGIVIKADGLASGKGVVVTHDTAEAVKTIDDFMRNPACSVKTDRILLEEKVTGKEVSAFALCDGNTFIPLGYACDYKRVHDNDEGPNTGGMGGYAPENWPSTAARQFVNERIFRPVLEGMKRRGMPFKGILFAGLMIDGDKVNVIEFNTRFGDPEAQILLPLMMDDIVPLFMHAALGKLSQVRPPAMAADCAVHVVMVSEGYPETFGTGMRLGQRIEISEAVNDALIFIAGAKRKDDYWVNDGGRVLGVTALGRTKEEAREQAYKTIGQIHFQGAHWRRDIGS
jgi:phosphoribosylamine---glycine ligase